MQPQPNAAPIFAQSLGWLCFFFFLLPFLAVMLRAMVWLSNRFMKLDPPIPPPKMSRALLIVTCNTAVQYVMAFLVTHFFHQFLPPQQAALTAQAIAFPAGFFKQSYVFSHMLPTTYARGMLVAVSYYVIIVAAVLATVALFAILFLAALLGAR